MTNFPNYVNSDANILERVTVAKLGGTISLSDLTSAEINLVMQQLHCQKLIKYSSNNSVYSYTTMSYRVTFMGDHTFTIMIDDAPTHVDPHSVFMLDIACIHTN